MAYTAWSVTQGEIPDTTKWNNLGNNDAYFYSFLGDNLEWQSYTPTLSGITVGNGTISAYYVVIGNTVFGRFRFDRGSSSSLSASACYFTPPVAWISDYNSYVYPMGYGYAEDYLVSAHPVYLFTDPSNPGYFLIRSGETLATSYVQNQSVTSGVPFTWGTSDYLDINFIYEKA